MRVIRAGWQGAKPQITIWDSTRKATLEIGLSGNFSWSVSGPKRCIGSFHDQYRPCPWDAEVQRFQQCSRCAPPDLELECIFEPRCKDGSACTCSFGTVPHVVYVAFYATLPKVGMTTAGRIATRLREQGADGWIVAGHCSDRATARRIEKAIARAHGLPEHRPSKQLLPQIARPIPWDRVQARAEDWAHRLGGDPTFHAIDDHPIDLPLPAVPEHRGVHGKHTGTWLGAKGRFAIYEADSPLGVGSPHLVAVRFQELTGLDLNLQP